MLGGAKAETANAIKYGGGRAAFYPKAYDKISVGLAGLLALFS
jgi:hypothetical protein